MQWSLPSKFMRPTLTIAPRATPLSMTLSSKMLKTTCISWIVMLRKALSLFPRLWPQRSLLTNSAMTILPLVGFTPHLKTQSAKSFFMMNVLAFLDSRRPEWQRLFLADNPFPAVPIVTAGFYFFIFVLQNLFLLQLYLSYFQSNHLFPLVLL